MHEVGAIENSPQALLCNCSVYVNNSPHNCEGEQLPSGLQMLELQTQHQNQSQMAGNPIMNFQLLDCDGNQLILCDHMHASSHSCTTN